MFLSNKYSLCYYNIVNRAKSRVLDEYNEIHHIIPKCLGGVNSKDNLVRLTAKEHFICHRLLVKMVEGKAKHQMSKAVDMMTVKAKQHSRYKIPGRLYERLKKEAAIAMSVLTKGKPKHTEESRRILSTKAKGRVSAFKGKMHSDAARKLLSTAHSKPCISPIGERFESTKEAAVAYGMSGPGIRGLIKRGRSGWRYERDEDQNIIELKLSSKIRKPLGPQSKDHIEKRVASRKKTKLKNLISPK